MSELEQTTKRGPGRPPKYHERVGGTGGSAAAVTVSAGAGGGGGYSATDAGTELPPRPNRKPFGGVRYRLEYPQRDGFHRHWFNDVSERISRAQEAGYEHVKDNEGKNVCRVVGVAEGGGPLQAYLMEIPEEWYKADMLEQQKQVDAREEAMRRGDADRQAGDGRYVPQQGISITRG